MAKKQDKQVIEVKPYEREYGRMDIRRYGQAAGKRDWLAKLFTIAILIVLAIGGIYAYYWAQSSSGQSFMTDSKSMLSKGVQYVTPSYWATRAQRIGNIWDTDTNPKSTEKGIIFKDFSILSPETPAGSAFNVLYDLEIKNTEVASIPITLSCGMEANDKTIKGTIIPSSTITVSVTTIDQAPVYQFLGQDTKGLKGSVEVEGKVSFPFETKDAKLKVYFTTKKVKDQLGKEDFFKFYKIKESLPIKVTYNGEPIKVGIGATHSKQPVVITKGINPIIGISLLNEWDGNMTSINSLNMYLPTGITINKKISQNPSTLCPFIKRRDGSATTEFAIADEFKKKISLAKGQSRSFRCWLDVDETFVGSGNYIQKEYEVDASYNYELEPKKASVTVIEVSSKK
jgi:hypothetical protein